MLEQSIMIIHLDRQEKLQNVAFRIAREVRDWNLGPPK